MNTVAHIQQLSGNFFFIQGPDQGRFPFSNSFLIDGSPRVLIDAGAGEAIIRELDKEKRIDVLLITHSHPDHILAAHVLNDRHLMLPNETPDSVHDLFELGKRFTGTDQGACYWKNRMVEGYGFHPLKQPDSRFSHGDSLEFGPVRLEAVHTPGHLADHYGFYENQARILLTTDIDFTGFGPWFGHAEADLERILADVNHFRNLASGACFMCSSHREPASSGFNRLFDDYLAAFKSHENKIIDLCTGGAAIDELVRQSPFYGNRFPDRYLQTIYEKVLIEKTLDRLIRSGTLAVENGVYSRQTEDIHANH